MTIKFYLKALWVLSNSITNEAPYLYHHKDKTNHFLEYGDIFQDKDGKGEPKRSGYPWVGETATTPKTTQRIYSSRQNTKAVSENVIFIWISGRQRPDSRAVNRFRSEWIKEEPETVLVVVLKNKLLKKVIRQIFRDLLLRLQKYEEIRT